MLASFNDLAKNELLPFLALKYCDFKNNRRKYKNLFQLKSNDIIDT